MRLERPPLWGILALLVLVLGNVALFVFMAARPDPVDPYSPRTASVTAAAPSATADRPAAAPVPEPAPDERPAVLVVGDGYAAGNQMGGRGAAGWPALVAQRTGAELVLAAVPQAGYASVGISGQTFVTLVEEAPVTDAAVTVLFGSRNDGDEDLATVTKNVTRAVGLVRQRAPESVLVVVGPAWSSAAVPASLLAVRDAVQAAALAQGATFVDPLAEGWFAQQSGLISADGVSPTDGGHGYLADQLTPVVQQALIRPGQQDD